MLAVLFVTALTQDKPLSAVLSAVVRIEVSAVRPNYVRPWQTEPLQRRRGTGFVIEGRRILTNFHVIEDAVDIRLSRSGDARRWSARLLQSGADVDLAILGVDANADEFFAPEVQPIKIAPTLPMLQDPVRVLGFPEGGRTICVTEGIVSRIDAKNYRLGLTASLSPGDHLVLQIDAAINSGNSGGPALAADGHLVGVAFQGLDAAQSVGYVIPASVVQTFLTNCLHGGGRYAGVQEVPFRVQRLEATALRSRLGVPPGTNGVVVTAVSDLMAVTNSSSLLVDDVITSIDGTELGNDYTVLLRAGERVGADYLITSKHIGSPTTLGLLRGGRRLAWSGVLGPIPPPIPRTHGLDASPEWVLICGFLFAPLTAPLVDAVSVENGGLDSRVHDVYRDAVERKHGFRRRDLPSPPIVLLDILTHEVNFGYPFGGWRVFKSFNGANTNQQWSLQRLYQRWRQAKLSAKPFVELRFTDESRAVLSTRECADAEPAILSRYGIPSVAAPSIMAHTGPRRRLEGSSQAEAPGRWTRRHRATARKHA